MLNWIRDQSHLREYGQRKAIAGAIPKISADHEQQTGYAVRKALPTNRKKLKHDDQTENVDRLIRKVKKCLYLGKPMPAIHNDMMIPPPDQSSCHRMQAIERCCNYMGIIPSSPP